MQDHSHHTSDIGRLTDAATRRLALVPPVGEVSQNTLLAAQDAVDEIVERWIAVAMWLRARRAQG